MSRIQIYGERSCHWSVLIAEAESTLGLSLSDDLRHYLALLLSEHQDKLEELEVDWVACWEGNATGHPDATPETLKCWAEGGLLSVGFYPGHIIQSSGGLDMAMFCVYGLYHHLGEKGRGCVQINDGLFVEVKDGLVSLVDVLMMIQTFALGVPVLSYDEALSFSDRFPDARFARYVLDQPQNALK